MIHECEESCVAVFSLTPLNLTPIASLHQGNDFHCIAQRGIQTNISDIGEDHYIRIRNKVRTTESSVVLTLEMCTITMMLKTTPLAGQESEDYLHNSYYLATQPFKPHSIHASQH